MPLFPSGYRVSHPGPVAVTCKPQVFCTQLLRAEAVAPLPWATSVMDPSCENQILNACPLANKQEPKERCPTVSSVMWEWASWPNGWSHLWGQGYPSGFFHVAREDLREFTKMCFPNTCSSQISGILSHHFVVLLRALLQTPKLFTHTKLFKNVVRELAKPGDFHLENALILQTPSKPFNHNKPGS